MDLNLDKIYEAWEKATGKSVSDNKIRISSNADWLRHQANSSLNEDPSGLLASILLKGAFKCLVEESTITIKDLIFNKDNSLEIINNFKQLNDVIENSKATELYNKLITRVLDASELLGRHISFEEINNLENSEEIFVDAIKHFNNDYKIIKEKFQDGGKLNKSGKVLSKLFKFEHYKQFINALKETNQDNFVCIALIDRTVETVRDAYDEKYDKFFAIGIKNNGNVYVVSDREVTRSPEAYAHSRNPAREYNNKLDYSHLPYNKFNEIYNGLKSDTLLLTDGSTNGLSEHFDIEAALYLGTLLMLVFDKYFTKSENLEKSNLSYFASDVKLLSKAECKALKVLDDNIIEKPDLDTSYSDYTGEDKLFNSGVFDCWLKEYPLEESNVKDLTIPNSIITDKNTMQHYAWWLIRRKQANHIKEELESAYAHKASQIREWVGGKLHDNAETIVNKMLKEPIRLGIKNYECSCEMFSDKPKKSDKPVLWVEYSKGNDLDLYDITHSHNYDNFDIDTRRYDSIDAVSQIIDTEFGKLKFRNYRGYCTAYFINDADSRKSRINLTLRSTYDLERFLNVNKEELPKPLRHFIYSRADVCTRWGWKPYSGNSILHLTDPMNDINNPFEDFHIGVTIALSKRKYNEIIKEISKHE